MEGRYTQNPCSGHFERYGDVSPTIVSITYSDLLDCQPTPMAQALESPCNRAKST
jgi:hypothetical protein